MKIKSTTLVIFGTIVVVVGGLGWLATRPRPGEFVSSLGNRHLQSLTEAHEEYNSTPPTSGPHIGGKASWGISDEQIPDELQLHNLEDGGVIVHYDSERVDDVTMASLQTIVASYADKVILEPYDGLEMSIVLTAWTRIDKLETFDEEKIRLFIDAFRGIDHHVR